MKQNNIVKYVIGISIAIGIYLISMFVGSAINVMVASIAGYRNYSEFLASDNLAGLVLIFFLSMINHIFSAWITVKLMYKYGEKYDVVNRRFYGYAVIAILVLVCVVLPTFFSKSPGLGVIIVHSIGICGFGNSIVKKNHVSTINEDIFCRKCGSKIPGDSKYCEFCGEKIMS